jgi:hypothetical protein
METLPVCQLAGETGHVRRTRFATENNIKRFLYREGKSMTEVDPYQTPETELNDSESSNLIIESVASGQKLIIYAILINLAATVLQIAVHPAIGLLGLVSLVMSIIGIIKLSTGLGSSLIAKIIYVVLMFLPLINLITLLVLNASATKALRANGYKVGLMGASKAG